MSSGKEYFWGAVIFFFLYIIALYFTGFFNIGLLSDDYLNFHDAVYSTLLDKFTGTLAFTNPSHFRPLYYISLQVSSYLHNMLGFSYDNFIFYRIQNLVVYFANVFLAGWIIFKKTGKPYYSLFALIIISLFPNNIHNICWTAGRVDLLCCLFYLLTLYFFFEYLKINSSPKLALSVLSFVLALTAKETAVTLPFVIVLFLMLENGVKGLKENIKIPLLFLGILALYIIYRTAILGRGFEKYYETDVISVTFKSILALLVPIDYLSFKTEVLGGDPMLFVYLAFLALFILIYLIVHIRKDAYKPLIYIALLQLILFLPYIYIGYIRPQMILIPFALTIIYLFLSLNWLKRFFADISLKIPSIAVLIILLFWLFYANAVIEDWTSAYKYSSSWMEKMLEINPESGKQIIVIGNPGRLKQSFMFDKLTGAYNYWKNKSFSIKDTINDIVQTGALDEQSLNSGLILKTITQGEYEILATGETQFFYMEGFENEQTKWKFSNKDMQVEAIENNFLNKPKRIRLKILSVDVNCYLASEMNYSKIN
jgi:hypothetical protein